MCDESRTHGLEEDCWKSTDGQVGNSLAVYPTRNIRQALRSIDAMQPAIVMVDEIEKALGGVSSSQGDSGVSARMFATFLGWLSDHESDVYVIASCNDISKLAPEFSRAERWDAVVRCWMAA